MRRGREENQNPTKHVGKNLCKIDDFGLLGLLGAHEGVKTAQDGPRRAKTAPRRSMKAPRGPKKLPRRPKRATRGPPIMPPEATIIDYPMVI